jgi:uncharacterized protein (TIGR02996 family)
VANSASFLRAILANPADDARRLVFADWLEEHDDHDRAEFIRVQCRLAGGDAEPVELPQLRERERQLLVANELRWTAPLHGLVRRARFVRGFPERITLTAEAFVTHGEALFDLAPVSHVIITEVGDHLPRLADVPQLGQVRTLEFRTLAGQDVGTLVRSPHLGQLTALILRYGGVDDAAAAVLADTPTLTRLTVLDLYGCSLGPAGIGAIASSPRLKGLTDLVLGDWQDIGYAGAEALDGPHVQLSGLTRLHLSFADIGDAGAEALAAAPALAGLRTLDLGYNEIGTDGAWALVDAPHLQSLTHLGLHGNPISRATRRTLAARLGGRVRV